MSIFFGGGTQDGRGMQGGKDRRKPLDPLDLSVGLRDFESGSEEGLCSHCTEANNQLRTNCLELRLQPWPACTDLFYARPLMDAELAAGLPLEVLDSIRKIDFLTIDRSLL
jgi:hypothetical protein